MSDTQLEKTTYPNSCFYIEKQHLDDYLVEGDEGHEAIRKYLDFPLIRVMSQSLEGLSLTRIYEHLIDDNPKYPGIGVSYKSSGPVYTLPSSITQRLTDDMLYQLSLRPESRINLSNGGVLFIGSIPTGARVLNISPRHAESDTHKGTVL